jgi:spermidine synthase
LLAEKGCEDLLEGKAGRPKHPKVLIGGLGMGFTLKRVLELIGKPATVEVAELVPEVIEWNRSFLVEHNGPLLEDDRTKIHLGDLYDLLMNCGKDVYDAILIDIDDTPEMLITEVNGRLYTPSFLERIKQALKPGGYVTYWLAMPTSSFEKTLKKAGFVVQSFPAKPHEKSKRTRHCIYVARPK